MRHIFTRKHPRILALPTQLQIDIKIFKNGKNFVKSAKIAGKIGSSEFSLSKKNHPFLLTK